MCRHFSVAVAVALALSFPNHPSTAQQVSTVQLSRPIPIDGIHMQSDGRLLAAAGYAGTRLHVIDMSGQVAEVADQLAGPIHAVIDERGDIYASNFSDQGSVTRIRADGTVDKIIVPQGPAGLAMGPDGFLYVAIYGANAGTGRSVYRISPDGTAEVFVEGSGIEAPIGIAFDENGMLFVVNARDGLIHRVTPDGDVSRFAQLPKGPGFFSSGHLVYSSGRFYASGNSSHVVYGISREGSVCTLFGTGSPGTGDGAGPEAEMTIPNGMTISPRGDELFVVAGGGGMNREFRRVRLPDAADGPCGVTHGDF